MRHLPCKQTGTLRVDKEREIQPKVSLEKNDIIYLNVLSSLMKNWIHGNESGALVIVTEKNTKRNNDTDIKEKLA